VADLGVWPFLPKTAACVGRLEGDGRSGVLSPVPDERGVFAPHILREENIYLWQ